MRRLLRSVAAQRHAAPAASVAACVVRKEQGARRAFACFHLCKVFIAQQLGGIEPMIATALIAAVGDATQFINGRQLAASLGLTPRQHSSDGKERLLGVSKRSDAYLRTLMMHGARSAIRTAKSKDDRVSRWALRVAARPHPDVAAVALANKTARMARAMLRHGTNYQPEPISA